MDKETLLKKKLPDAPGVYFFLGARKEILYIGKATSLKNRVRSYFAPDLRLKRSELIEKMVVEAKNVESTVTDSVLEALILETNLIRTHKPKFNTISKDDKSYNHLIITNEEWPRVLVVRGKDLDDYDCAYHFGPFPSGQLFREALKIVRRLFQFYDTRRPIGEEKSKLARGKIDFNRQIGLYPEAGDKKDYLRTIRHIRLFFEGKKGEIIRELEKEMKAAAKAERFEDANLLKKKIFALQHIQDIALIKDDSRIYRDENSARIEAYDVAHLQGEDMVGVMTVVEGGEMKRAEYRKFKIQSVTGPNDPAALREVLERRLHHVEWPFPQIIAVDGSTAQKNVAERVLRKRGLMIPVVAVVKDDRHRPVRVLGPASLLKKHHDAILLANAEAHRFSIGFHRERRNHRLV
jgi:excinuclease ABC subunit C